MAPPAVHSGHLPQSLAELIRQSLQFVLVTCNQVQYLSTFEALVFRFSATFNVPSVTLWGQL